MTGRWNASGNGGCQLPRLLCVLQKHWPNHRTSALPAIEHSHTHTPLCSIIPLQDFYSFFFCQMCSKVINYKFSAFLHISSLYRAILSISILRVVHQAMAVCVSLCSLKPHTFSLWRIPQSPGFQWTAAHQVKSPHPSLARWSRLGSTDNQDIMLLFVWHQTPPTPSPHYHHCDRRKLFRIFRCPVGQGYKNTNLATLHFESPLNCVFTPVIILGGSRPVPVGFVERWRWCARRRCLNTDRKRTLQWFICYARACSTSAVLLVFRQLCTVLLTP